MTAPDDVSLREYIDTRIGAVEGRIDRLEDHWAQRGAIHETAHSREHALTEEAIDRAREAMEKRLDGMNEFRGQLSDQAARFVARAEFDIATATFRRELAQTSRFVWMGLGIVSLLAAAIPVLVSVMT